MSTICLRYKVNKFIPEFAPHGDPRQWRYQCQKRMPQGWYLKFSAMMKSFQEARQLCEQDAAA